MPSCCHALQGFIRVVGGRFVDEATCQEWVPHGWNGWELTANALSNPSAITAKFRQAQACRCAADGTRAVLLPAGRQGAGCMAVAEQRSIPPPHYPPPTLSVQAAGLNLLRFFLDDDEAAPAFLLGPGGLAS